MWTSTGSIARYPYLGRHLANKPRLGYCLGSDLFYFDILLAFQVFCSLVPFLHIHIYILYFYILYIFPVCLL